MGNQSKVTVKGTGQLNGPVIINKTVEMDTSMAQKFVGGNRYQVIEDFVRTHYPGVKINPKSFGANVVPIKVVSAKTKEQNSPVSKNSTTNSSSSGKVLTPIVVSEPKLTQITH